MKGGVGVRGAEPPHSKGEQGAAVAAEGPLRRRLRREGGARGGAP